MKAILCTHFGTPDDLELADIPQPAAGPGEAVVRVKAAALNFFDLLIIAGKYQHKPPFPFSPASEFAGIVESVGAGVTEIAPGDRVMGSTGWGAAREILVARATQLVKLPEQLDFERAAGLTVTYATTLYGLRERGELKTGETLVVLGASGGVGLAAVEIGKIMGARVIACASSDEKLAFARSHGADETVNYASEDLRGALKRLGGERGVDVVYDPVGGPYAEPAVRALGWEGRYLVVGFAAGEIPKLPLNLVLLKSCDIRGVLWGAWTTREPAAQRALMTDIVRWCAEGRLSAHVHAVYPLSEIATALKAIADRKVMGKIVLRP
jgi:NADPH:quinone reductase